MPPTSGLQRAIPMRVRMNFAKDQNSQYGRFIASPEEIENTPVEQILHNSDEILAFVQSHSNEPESRLLLDWLVNPYMEYLKLIRQDEHSDPDTWIVRINGGEPNPQEREIFKGKVYALRGSAKLRERFDALYENARAAQANSPWVAKDGLMDVAKGLVLIVMNKVNGE